MIPYHNLAANPWFNKKKIWTMRFGLQSDVEGWIKTYGMGFDWFFNSQEDPYNTLDGLKPPPNGDEY